MWVSIIASFAAILQQIFKYFSSDSKLERIEISEVKAKTKETIEAEKLNSQYERIAAEPEKDKETLVEKFRHNEER